MNPSKTQMRMFGLGGTARRIGRRKGPSVAFRLDRRFKVYDALFQTARNLIGADSSEDEPFGTAPWIRFLEAQGLTRSLIKRQQIAYIPDERQAVENLMMRFSFQSLVGAGLLDPDGQFRFARHRILIPFLHSREIKFFFGIDFETGFDDPRVPTSKWPQPYEIQGVKRQVLPSRVYLTTDLFSGLRLGALGYRAWVLQGLQQLNSPLMKEIAHQSPVFCLARGFRRHDVIQPIREAMESFCGQFRFQPLEKVETEWLLVQSRKERAQLVESPSSGGGAQALLRSVVDKFRPNRRTTPNPRAS